jgi:transposase
MKSMPKSPRKFPPEVRERAIRLVAEWREARGRTEGGFQEVASEMGVHIETLRGWWKQSQIDQGGQPGLRTEDKVRIAELERENRELKRANDILKAATAFFARELDPPFRK